MNTWLIADIREKDPMPTLRRYPKKIEFRTLETGDYACSAGCCGFERKALDFDNYSRTLMQLNELVQDYKNPHLIVNMQNPSVWLEASGAHMYPMRVGYYASLIRRQLIPIIVWDHLHMIDLMYAVINKYHDGKVRGEPGEFHSVRRYTDKDQAVHVLMGFPGISRGRAEMILKEFGSVGNFLRADRKTMQSIHGIGPKTVNSVLDVMWKEVE